MPPPIRGTALGRRGCFHGRTGQKELIFYFPIIYTLQLKHKPSNCTTTLYAQKSIHCRSSSPTAPAGAPSLTRERIITANTRSLTTPGSYSRSTIHCRPSARSSPSAPAGAAYIRPTFQSNNTHILPDTHVWNITNGTRRCHVVTRERSATANAPSRPPAGYGRSRHQRAAARLTFPLRS